MKKTQSLKLMLLGLLASVSTSALAYENDVFLDETSGLVCQELPGKKAKVIAIYSMNATAKAITIPTVVKNGWERDKKNLPKVLRVNQLADNWYNAGLEIWLVKDGVAQYKTQLVNALDFDGITLTIEAEDLETISTKAIQPLSKKIKTFVVAGPDNTATPATPGAGLKAIPDYAFFYGDAAVNPVAVFKAEQALALLDKDSQGFTFDPIHPNRTYCGDKNGKVVYSLNNGADYVIFGDKVNTVELGFPESTYELDWYEAISVVSFKRVGYLRESTTAANPGVRFAATVDATPNAGTNFPFPAAVTFEDDEDCLTFTGLKTVLADRLTELQSANSALTTANNAPAYNEKKKAVTDAEAKLAEDKGLLALAEAKDIVNLWGNTANADQDVVDALADLDNTDLYDALDADQQAAFNTILNTLQRTDINWPTTTTEATDASWEKGALVETDPLEGYTEDTEIPTATIGETTYNVYSKVDGETKTYRIQDGENVFEATYTPATAAKTGYVPFNSFTLKSTIRSDEAKLQTAQEELAEYEAQNINGLKNTQADAQAAYDRADAAMTEANAALAAAIAKAEKDLADAQNGDFDPENAEDNTVLTRVDLLGEKIETIGKSAFQNCINAVFGKVLDSRLPLSTKVIGARAFQRTKIQPVFVDAANGDMESLESIGDYAFADPIDGNGTKVADFTKNQNLKSFGEDVFANDKLQSLKLKGTAIETLPEILAQDLYKETSKFIDDCGNFYNYDVENDEDVTALKAAWKAKFNRDMTPEDIVNMDKGELEVNTTLKTASLPEAIKAIPVEAFMNDIKLATLDGGIPVPVETIGARAFFRTKIKAFDLTNNVNLTSVGSQAFAGNSELTKVILPQDKKDASGNVIAEAKLTTLGAGVFECDGDLGEVVLSPDITCLPAGTFAGNNKITTLDLSNTQIEVLYNLFGTEELIKNNKYNERYKDEHANTSLTKIILPEQKIDETDNKTVLIPGLKIIDEYALAYMQGLTDVTIPSSVFWMGDSVFYNDINLKTVTAMDSRLVTIGFNTFRNCRKLETFTFVTLNVVDPYGDTLEGVELDDLIEAGEITNVCDLRSLPELNPFFDDHNFFMTNATTLIMTKESIKALQDVMPTEIGFTNFQEWQPVLLTHTDGTLPYYNENYATWIKMDQADVYTCYQDVVDQGVKIYMVKAKHNQGFYKIPAATTIEFGDNTFDGSINWRPDNSVYTFPGYNDTFMDWYIDGPAQDFSSEASYYLFTPSAAVIIVEKKDGGADGIKGQIPYERHSAANLISQSTLDPGNQMKITRTPLDKLSSSSNIMWYAHSGNEPNTWHGPITDGVIPAGKLVLPLSAGQANGNDPLPSRIEVIWLDDDLTGIMDVKDYIKSLRDSEAIYNLQGVKVTAPVKGQMYIQGGKKFIQK